MEKQYRRSLSLVILGVALGMVLHAVVTAYMVRESRQAESIKNAGQVIINTGEYPAASENPIMSV